MALPSINSTPSYELTIPSSGQSVTFRPFLVKEQKNLLIAMETQERKDMMRSIVRTIESCVEERIKEELTIFDVDYMFTKIRSKSVGETATLLLDCEDCNTQNEVTVELDKVFLEGEIVKDKVIKLTDDVSIKMRYPTYHDFMNNDMIFEDNSLTETLLEMVMSCIDIIMTKDERFDIRDEPREEVVRFVDSMNSEQFERLSDFVNNIPTIKQETIFSCSSCGHENGKTLEGITDFF